MDQNNTSTRQLGTHDAALVDTIIMVALLASNCENIPDCQLKAVRSFLKNTRTGAAANGETLPNIEKLLLYLNSYANSLKAHSQGTSSTTQNKQENVTHETSSGLTMMFCSMMLGSSQIDSTKKSL
uniref:Uncharacterized protein n=1 Tax=Anopheles farauti TaxID=69004 RepID=A0A182QL84_9DIPT